ncbi:UNVERIFIED_CONTAM: putative serine/threonine-protein kinase [Sesamum calycinum]|uniref:Serine/threonine-protein kinase n=1 Tax=Sesamum calycinum TaxID=2727403 RepID=A0AAW2R7K8_9LAMI
MCRVFSVRNGVDGAQVVAGWPSWLTSVAGEAIKGWIPRKADSFEKLDKIGQGTYSSVYRARDLETGKIVALKKVRFVNMDPESVRFMSREILILRRLDHPHVMRLEGLVTSRVSGNLYLVFEYMEHDLAGLAASPAVKFTEPHRGVLHRDIKGSNLLIDNHGNLKIGDFGLATFFHASKKQPLTSRVVTLWYRPPELLLGATDYGVSVDLWSSGCILAELFAGKPIMPGRTEVEQLHKIFKLCGSPSEEYWKTSKLPHATIFKPQHPYRRCVTDTFKDFPPSALSLLESLLAFEPELRGTTTSALHSEFFTTKPLPCDPSSLPKYHPAKNLMPKCEMRRQEGIYSIPTPMELLFLPFGMILARYRAAGGKGGGAESSRKGSKESRAVPAPDANAELQASIQKWKEQSNPKSNSEMYNRGENGGSGFPMGPSRGSMQTGHSMLMGSSGSSSQAADEGLHMKSRRALDSTGCRELKIQRSFKPQGTTSRLSRFSNLVADGSSQLDFGRDRWPDHCSNTTYEEINEGESSNHLLGRPDSPYKNNGQAPRKENNTVRSHLNFSFTFSSFHVSQTEAEKRRVMSSDLTFLFETQGYGFKKTRMHYSGPLLPPGGSVEEMLKEHEKQIQIAVRKARIDKNKTRKGYTDNGQTDSLLGYVNNGH